MADTTRAPVRRPRGPRGPAKPGSKRAEQERLRAEKQVEKNRSNLLKFFYKMDVQARKMKLNYAPLEHEDGLTRELESFIQNPLLPGPVKRYMIKALQKVKMFYEIQTITDEILEIPSVQNALRTQETLDGDHELLDHILLYEPPETASDDSTADDIYAEWQETVMENLNKMIEKKKIRM